MKNFTNKILIVLAITCIGFDLYSQSIKSYTGNFVVGLSNGNASYQYYVDSNDNQIKSGKFTYNGAIEGKLTETITGSYKNNLKNGKWIYTTSTVPGLRTISTQKFFGTYKMGKPDSIWTLSSTTSYVPGTQMNGKSLTGVSVTINGSANYKNGVYTGKFKFDRKQTGNYSSPSYIEGQFDNNGLMDGKWVIKFNEYANGPMFEHTRYYKHGARIKANVLEVQTGETTPTNWDDHLIYSSLDTLSGLYIYNGAIYSAEEICEENINSSATYAVKLAEASNFFCKNVEDDHYHHNTKGCLACGGCFSRLEFKKQVYWNDKYSYSYGKDLAINSFSSDYKKSASIINVMLESPLAEANSGYRQFLYTKLGSYNCLLGKFNDNITLLKNSWLITLDSLDKHYFNKDYYDLIKDNRYNYFYDQNEDYKKDRSFVMLYLGHSYLLTGQYEEAKKCYWEFGKNLDFKKLQKILSDNLSYLKTLGYHNDDCDKILEEVKAEALK
jgi:hypothetical protein